MIKKKKKKLLQVTQGRKQFIYIKYHCKKQKFKKKKKKKIAKKEKKEIATSNSMKKTIAL